MEKKFYKASNDAVFKAMFCNIKNEDLLKRLIETSLQEKVEIIKILPPEILKKNVYVKNKTLDVIVKAKNEIICIEMNSSYYDGLNRRNFGYIASKYSEEVKVGEDYTKMKTFIQLNFTKSLPKNHPVVKKCTVNDKKTKIDYIDNFVIYEFNLDKLSETCYNEDEMYKFIALLDADKEKIHKISKGDKDMEKFEKEINNLNEDVEFTTWISAEEDARKVHNTLIKNAQKEGKLKVAKNLLNKNIDIDLISEVTELTKEEIENLK